MNAVCIYLPHILRSPGSKKYGIKAYFFITRSLLVEGNLPKQIYVGIISNKIVSTV